MRILIIEDDEEIVDFLEKGFSNEGYEIEVANNGTKALQMIYPDRYDVILLDLMLPGINGKQLLNNVRNKKIIIPIIVLTAISDFKTKIDLLNAGADDYLEKPFSFHELIARIKAVLRRTGRITLKNDKIEVADLELYPHKKEVYRKKRTINLRKKEFELLEYLIKNKNTVIKRDRLMEDIWEYNSSVCSNTIDTHIASLRKKIDEGHDIKLIRTVHAVGYKLSEE